MNRKLIYIGLIVGSTLLSSCDKYLDVKPVGMVMPRTTEDFRALMLNSYSSFPQHKSYLGLRTDEYVLRSGTLDVDFIKDFYIWKDQNQEVSATLMPYGQFYKSIFNANHIIKEIDEMAGISAANNQIKAEAYAMRAYAHFELLNIYADNYNPATASTDKGVPVITEIDLEIIPVRSSVADVYAQIFKDLDASEALFVENSPTTENFRYRFSKRAFYALKSRIHLYRQEWAFAKANAENALSLNNNLEDLNNTTKLPNEFTSAEVIQALDYSANTSVNNSTYVNPNFVALYNDSGDLRKTKYFSLNGSNYGSLKGGNVKFKTTFRNAEMYLNIAEAEAQLNNLDNAKKAVLELAVKRLTPTYYSNYETFINGLGKEDLIIEIFNERAREFALEGLRWYDLKRSTRPGITHTFNGETYVLQQDDARYVIQFPRDAVQKNPNLLN